MALDQTTFDAIRFELIKKKYYDAAAVNAALEELRRLALSLQGENERLRQEAAQLRETLAASRRESEALRMQLGCLDEKRAEIGDAILSAKTIARQMLAEAEDEARQVRERAEESARALTEEALRDNQAIKAETEALRCGLPQRLDELEQQLRDKLLGAADELGGLLRGFPVDDEAAAPPKDLSDRVGAIAQQIADIDGE